jgi:GTP-binding protein EngB required for normal cell division
MAVELAKQGGLEQLNENQRRHLLVTFQHIDKLLSDSERILTEADESAFSLHIPDATPVQARLLHEYVVRVRKAMRDLLEENKIPIEKPQISALWGFHTSLVFVEIALEELAPKYMRGYGLLSEASAQQIEIATAHLLDLVGRMLNYLNSTQNEDFQTRLQRLDKTTEEVALLNRLEKIIASRGLIELRSTVSLLIERLETQTLDIAFFGRVNTGKSSLLNYLLGSNILPVGVTPITAVPVQIKYGAEPSAKISFAEEKPIDVPPNELHEYASEQGNPGNRKNVTHIEVELNQGILKKGIRFVDTPGLGSLATFGQKETLAYLPRCDLGILLIDASSTLNQDDLMVMRLLYESGATAMPIISKADLLSETQRLQVSGYVHQKVKSELNLDLPVYCVSTIPEGHELVERWLNEILPLLDKQKSLAAASIRRKVGALRDAVIASLRNRLNTPDKPGSALRKKKMEVEEALRSAPSLIEATRKRIGQLIRSIDLSGGNILERSTDQILQANDRQEYDVRQIVSHQIAEATANASFQIVEIMRDLRNRLSLISDQARSMSSLENEADPLPELQGLPGLDSVTVADQLNWKQPRFSFLGKSFVRKSAFEQLNEQLGDSISGALRVYRKQLEDWSLPELKRLQKKFEESVAQFQSLSSQQEISETDEKLRKEIEQDLELLTRSVSS